MSNNEHSQDPPPEGHVRTDMQDLARRIAGLSPEKRSALGKLFKGEGVNARVLPIPRADRSGTLPLSFAQRRLWFLHQLDPGSLAYVVPSAFRLSGKLSLQALQQSLDELVGRHEVLRTTYELRDGEPAQVIAENVRVPLPVIDISGGEESARLSEMRRLAAEEAARPFDLAAGPVLRASVLRLAEEDHVLLLTLHHIAYDGWSVGILIGELCALYAAFVKGEPAALPALPIQYADFAAWQRQQLQGPVLDAELSFWRHQLEGFETLRLPTDRPRPRVQAFRGAVHSRLLSREATARLKELGRTEGATPFVTFLAAFAALLARYSGQSDIVLGTPVAGRSRSEVEGLIGFFINSLVVRAAVSGQETFRELLWQVRDTMRASLQHQAVPFDRLVDELQIPRDLSYNPIFQVMFALQDAPWQERRMPGLSLQLQPGVTTTARIDLELNLWEGPDGLVASFYYNTDLFDGATIERVAGHYERLVAAVASRPDDRVRWLPLLDAAETRTLVRDFNAGSSAYPSGASIHALVEAQVRRTPGAVAVSFFGVDLTYAQLNARANKLARHLRRLRAGRDTLVGVCLDRSADLVVAFLAILKAGAGYLPLDPSYPRERLAFMLADTTVPIVISNVHLSEGLPAHAGTTLLVDRDWPLVDGESAANLPDETDPDDVAYVVYTSGSTGVPKGSAIPHRAVNRLVLNTNYVALGPADRVAQASNSAFDAATFEIWGALLTGARLVGVSRDVALSPREFASELRDKRITALFLTTALFNQMTREAPGAFAPLTHVLFGGEAVDVASVRAVLRDVPPARLVHVYGPTENTTFSTWHLVTSVPDDAHTVPIGRTISNSQTYVLDASLNLVPIGVTGELYVGGDGLARGYVARPDLTAEKFIPNPFDGRPGARMYRTGDLVRLLPDGSIEFVGRADHQVKIHGFRIEPGEIDAVLAQHPAVEDAVVHVREDVPGDRRLVGYVVWREDAAGTEPGELRAYLKSRLPEYMVPSAFVVLPALPLSPNGKVDRRALPAPAGERQVEDAYVEPRNEMEARIAAIWREALQIDRVGVRDNFFDLGGHSLLLVEVHRRLVEAVGPKVSVVDLFAYPTVEQLARHLGGDSSRPAVLEAAQSRVSRRAAARSQSIAIVGMAGRFPGAADVDAFWRNLREGVESIRVFTEAELRAAGVDERLLAHPDYVKARGVLDDADLFDPQLFGYTPRDAELMDPQHRVFLECAWHALDHAGCDPDRFDGLIGVYAGAGMNTYLFNLLSRPELMASAGALQTVMSAGADFLPTRVSYKLNLHGPSVSVQTACSTSLVAVHQACQSLSNFECDMALAGGVSITVPLKSGYLYQAESIASPDGHCRAFDAEARGTVSGNGAAVVVLKRLEDAVADGDHIHAVIRGSAINNDGSRKVGYTAPSVDGQAEAIALAQAGAGVEPAEVSYVEAHGTGTPLGDPVEIAALSRVFGDGLDRQVDCAIGSLKTNVGHMDAAAGVAGLIKTALAIEHAELPPSLHFQEPNPKADFASTPLRVNARFTQWTLPPGMRRIAGVSSFGIGGTNAHAVLEEAPRREPSSPSRPAQLLPLSARTEAALDAASAALATALEANPAVPLADIAYTLQTGRRELAWRRTIVCRTHDEAGEALRSPDRRLGGTNECRDGRPSVAFAFPGQGAQHPGMAVELYETEPAFRDRVDACCDVLLARHGLALRDVLLPPPGEVDRAAARLERTDVTQPALFVVEYALAQLWISWGVTPEAMIGHSLGEYVAACLAGVFSLDDALDLVVKRGRLVAALPAGAMISVDLPASELARLAPDVAIAASNGPGLSVASGPLESIAALEGRLRGRGHAPRRLRTSHAFHSAMMDPAVESLRRHLGGVRLAAPRIPFVSNLTGTWISDAEATSPDYWARHMRETVRFDDGLATFFAEPRRAVIEVGPGRTLTTLASRHKSRAADHVVAASLPGVRDESTTAGESMLAALGALWRAGLRPDWAGVHAGETRHKVILPGYPFERRRYWIDARRPEGEPQALAVQPLERWFAVPSWKRVPLLPGNATPRADRWLVFVDGGGLSESIVAELMSKGAEVATVRAGSRFEMPTAGAFLIDPRSAADYVALVRELSARGFPRRIVHGWTLAPVKAGTSPDLTLGFHSLVFLLQALGEAQVIEPVHLTVVSTGVQDVTGRDRLIPAHAAVLGPVQAAPLEYPNLTACSIDVSLDEVDPASLARAAVAESLAGGADAVLAYRGGHRWVQTIEDVALGPVALGQSRLRDRGVYMIVGGLGGVGLEIAEYLATAVSARLVLVSRSAPSEAGAGPTFRSGASGAPDASDAMTERVRRRRERVARLEALGAEVLVCTADASSASEMASVAARAESRFGPINGIIHTAGVPGGSVLQRLTPAQAAAVFSPKLHAAAVIEQFLDRPGLDFVVLSSSLISYLPMAGRADYMAANACVDRFGREARSGTAPVIVVNWDTWRDVGMAVDTVDARQPGLRGEPLAEGMRSADGVEAFSRILASGLPQVLVSTYGSAALARRHAAKQAPNVQEPAAAAPARPAVTLHPRPAMRTDYVAPTTAAERALVDIWESLLGIGPIGVLDNFFELGGDSVVSIQIISRATMAGLRLTPKQVFDHQTVAELAAIAAPAGETLPVPREDEEQEGALALTPIQSWFFEQEIPFRNHFNQTILLSTPARLDVAALRAAVAALERRHGALRLRCAEDAGTFRLTIAAPAAEPPVAVIDVSGLAEDERRARIASAGTELQASLDLADGPAYRVAYFADDRPGGGRLLFTAHHLAVDTISWRIIVEDLTLAFEQASRGAAVALPAPTASLRRWTRLLDDYAQAPEVQAQLPAWLAIAGRDVPALPVDFLTGGNTIASTSTVVSAFEPEETRQLLQAVPRTYDTQINDALLSALAVAFRSWTGSGTLLVDVEGHGRESIAGDVDISRTVGWFTTMYPLCLEVEEVRLPEQVLERVKDQVRQVPGRGIGYGLLRYLARNTAAVEALRQARRAEVLFLYLGQFDQRAQDAVTFGRATEPVGPERHQDAERAHLIEVTGVIRDGRLQVSWTYSTHRHRRETIAALAGQFERALREIVERSVSGAGRPSTPADFPHAGLDQASLDSLLSRLAGS
jgi:amino acid adenylation domain-containing protein/non-ribosomal peptide synthase protein (TIGR01720 family)